ncbi:MAG: type II toxin-antitoxin system PemK/MazF family toxin [Acidimicrobiales bacterium]
MRSRLTTGRILDLVQRAVRALSPSTRRPPAPTPSTSKPSTSKPSTSKPSAPSGGGREPAAVDIELDGTRFEYSPSMDGDPDPGEVVWTWVPYEDDPSQGKDRPVVVVGRRGDRLVGVALTSKRHDNEPQLEVGTGPWDHEGRTSYAKLDRVLALDPDQVRREGAVLAKGRFDDLVEALRRVHGMVPRPR